MTVAKRNHHAASHAAAKTPLHDDPHAVDGAPSGA